jgi:hypothetical protein
MTQTRNTVVIPTAAQSLGVLLKSARDRKQRPKDKG